MDEKELVEWLHHGAKANPWHGKMLVFAADTIERLTAERDDLLAALRGVLEWDVFPVGRDKNVLFGVVIKAVSAAIAKAEAAP